MFKRLLSLPLDVVINTIETIAEILKIISANKQSRYQKGDKE